MSAPSLSDATVCAPNGRVFSLHDQLNGSASGTVGDTVMWDHLPFFLEAGVTLNWHWSMPVLLVGCIGIGATLEKWPLGWAGWMGLDHRIR